MTNQNNKPLFILGWDAATWDLMLPWVNEGTLPNLAKLMRIGCYGKLHSTPLPLSPPAWSTIITGVNPGRHGVYDWFARKPGSYDIEYIHTGQITAKPIWEYLNEGGKSVGICWVPVLFPAVKVDGFMISGMAAPNLNMLGYAYPPTLVDEIQASCRPYIAGEGEVFSLAQADKYLKTLLDWLDYQKKVALFLIKHKPCDVYLFVFMQSDHVQHKFWRYSDTSFPGYNQTLNQVCSTAIKQVFQELDRFVGDLWEEFREEATYVILSDHGAGPNYGVLYVNHWLVKEGFLKLMRTPLTRLKTFLAKTNIILWGYRWLNKAGFGRLALLLPKKFRNQVLTAFVSPKDIDWLHTKAYARGAFGQIFINLKGREPQGIVGTGREYEELVSKIISRLKHLTHPVSGDPLISEVNRKGEVFHGPHLEKSADIVFSIQNYTYQTSANFGMHNRELIGPSEYEDSGGHRPQGVLVMAGKGIIPGRECINSDLTDITPTILALAGIPVPSDLDGKPLVDTFTTSQKERISFSAVSKEVEEEKSRVPELSSEEIAILEERLRNLGYLG